MSAGPTPPFDRDRWLRLSPLLDEGLSLDGAERAAWLDRLRTRDAALADEVAAALAQHAALQAEGFLEASPAAPAPGATLAGLVVGAWTLRSPLGQGGMGTVWLAERSDGRFTGRAAVKLLNASLVGREGEARFRREASILARLRHPHIAALIDAGVSSLGQPYLVLEHVDGERIDRHCESSGLDVAGRIRLFLQILEAVAHAHAHLIVHRDIKPQNVLVDRDGRVRLLDFGIARLLEPDAEEPFTVTREGETALTPEYAAPEQVTGGHVTTATDLYSLGVLLCVLLSGNHPSGSTRRTPAEWVRVIADTEPRPVSELAARSTRHGRLAAALRGDLDNIVGKALRKDPRERYPSAEAFADDLRRHLRHEPVSARPDTPLYRTVKFVRRHPFGTTAAAAALLATMLFTAGIAWQAREARRQRDEAREQMARATAAREFLGFLLGAAFPPGSLQSPDNLLEQGEGVIEKEYADNGPLRAEMLVAVGKQYIASEHYEKATPVLERAAAIAAGSRDPALQARALCPLAVLHAVNGRKDEADAVMERALAGIPEEPLYALQRAECLINRASVNSYFDQAESLKRDGAGALAILDSVPIPAASMRISAMGAVAYGHYLAKESREADALYAGILRALEKSGRDRTLLASDMFNNWSLVHYTGNIARAESLSRRAVEIRRPIEGATISSTITFNHAGALLQLARYDEAEPLFEETIRTARARKDPLIETDAMLELSELYVERGDLKRAAAQLTTLGPLLTGPKPDGFRVVQMAYYKGRLSLARGDAAAARDGFAAAVEVFEKRNSRLALFVFSLIGLSRAQRDLGDAGAAAKAGERAVEIATTLVQADTPSYLIGLSQAAVAEARLAAGDSAAARSAFTSALEQLTATLGEVHPATLAVRRSLAGL